MSAVCGAAPVRAQHGAHARAPLPPPHLLAALRTVLCLHHARSGELGGWAHAVHAAACGEVDSDGLYESVLFFDRDGRCCWRLHVLPDSDFLAWEQLCATLPAVRDAPTHTDGVALRLWTRLSGQMRGGHLQASALRLHALPVEPGSASLRITVLAASLSALSPAGTVAARRIARRHGIERDSLAEDGCCRHAVGDARNRVAQDAYPLIRLNLGTHA